MEIAELALLAKLQNLNVSEFLVMSGMSSMEIWRQLQEAKQWSGCELQEQQKLFAAKVESLRGFDWIYPGHPYYPPEFCCLKDAPVFLSYLGPLNLLHREKVSVVGSRHSLPAFEEWMNVHFVEFLKKSSACVVSGGARGIDQKASKLALLSGQSTVIVLPSGILNPYPAVLRSLYGAQNVLFLSEYWPDTVMYKGHFLARNRLVTALGCFLLVVQAALKSGSLVSVRYALEQGKDVATLPDFPGIEASSGNLKIIKEGGQIVTHAADLIQLFSMCAVTAPRPEGDNQEERIR